MERSKSNPIQIQKYLKGLDYPVNKSDVIKQAKKNGAEREVIDILNTLEDQEYSSSVDVSKSVSQEH